MNYIDRRLAGLRGDAATDARHARLAAALLLDWLIADAACVHQLEQAWGKPDTLTKSGESKPAIAHARLLVAGVAGYTSQLPALTCDGCRQPLAAGAIDSADCIGGRHALTYCGSFVWLPFACPGLT
jgi:hypothetical protein